MRMNGEKVHFERLRDNADCAHRVYLRMCFDGGESASELKAAGQNFIETIRRLRDSGEEW